MASVSGLAFFISESNRFAQKFSVAADEVGPLTAQIVEEELIKGTGRMRQIILAGGINKTKKGGPRVKSGRMLDAVEGTSRLNGRARVQGKFGFADDAPKWTLYQEKGTFGGQRISQMLAFSTANRELVDALQQRFAQGDWFNVNF